MEFDFFDFMVEHFLWFWFGILIFAIKSVIADLRELPKNRHKSVLYKRIEEKGNEN